MDLVSPGPSTDTLDVTSLKAVLLALVLIVGFAPSALAAEADAEVMIALAGALVFAPDVMTTLSGAMTVFGIALVAILVILGTQWMLRRYRHGKGGRRSLGRARC